MDIKIEIVNNIDEVESYNWDACSYNIGKNKVTESDSRPLDPFTTHRFLRALEKSKSVGKGTGWYPQHLVALRNNEVVGVLPMYLKNDSQGEYIFDHNWAQAYHNAGGYYYPKLQVSVPFTPATGRRFLLKHKDDNLVISEFLKFIKAFSIKNNLSSAHVTFCESYEKDIPIKMGFLDRETYQFHWKNDNFRNFDCFLSTLSHRKRKSIKKERKVAAEFGGEILTLSGRDIKAEHWDYFWKFYQNTGSRKWGKPYLTRNFFREIHKNMVDDVLLVLAVRHDRPVAGALNFIGSNTLYGRYWGMTEYYKFLHYELCYYQAIDYAIKNGLKKVEAGAQGDHKISRGYLPCKINSLHWFSHNGMHKAIENYLISEKDASSLDEKILKKISPFKEVNDNGRKSISGSKK